MHKIEAEWSKMGKGVQERQKGVWREETWYKETWWKRSMGGVARQFFSLYDATP